MIGDANQGLKCFLLRCNDRCMKTNNQWSMIINTCFVIQIVAFRTYIMLLIISVISCDEYYIILVQTVNSNLIIQGILIIRNEL